ncbi:MAG: type II secretion system inner membrane protein GspF [Myxococcaceae bacterium]
MPVFEYRGLNESGKTVTGLLEADTPKLLRTQLRRDGVYLTAVVGEQRPGAQKTSREVRLRGRISGEDIAITTRQLATLLHAGVALVEALTALVDQVDKEQLKRVLSDVKQRVNEGSALAEAMGQHPRVFSALYVNMVRAGEHSGALDAVLTRLADFTEAQAQLRSRILATMLYPAVMLVIGGGILVLLMTVVVPKVTKVFETMKVALPITTRILIGTSGFLANYWFLVFPALVGILFAIAAWARSPRGRPIWDRKMLELPVFGELVRMLAVSRFARTLATLLKSGVPLLGAMDITKNVVTNTVLSDVLEKAREAVREGEGLSGPLKRSGEFPALVHHMIAVGERSGQLEDMLVSVADSYESQVNVKIGALTALLEPLMIVAMGGVIAFVTFSILMPILQLNTAIH